MAPENMVQKFLNKNISLIPWGQFLSYQIRLIIVGIHIGSSCTKKGNTFNTNKCSGVNLMDTFNKIYSSIMCEKYSK